jgi:N6-L-threonylcarbamoyladenine synthase
MSGPLLLSIESSCDETGVALIDGGRRILSNVVASQVALHAPTGGIVPELAARAHLRWIVPSLDEAWAAAGVEWRDVDGIAVTYGPGLAGSLLVGINFAKALSWVHDVPLVGVNHLEGHVYAAWLLDKGEDDATKVEPIFPLVALIVSGGHTFIAEMTDHLTYRLLGTTVDDAAGEAFDKVGRLLGLGYPGGPAIQKAAEGAVRRDVRFPRAWMGDSYDLSFSGLKTAARRIVAEARADAGIVPDDADTPLGDATTAELAWGFQDAVVDVLATKTARAAREIGARSIVLGGGVAANACLRERLAGEAEALRVPLIVPRPGLCTDNGAMIGAAGARRFEAGERARLDLDARPSLPLARR